MGAFDTPEAVRSWLAAAALDVRGGTLGADDAQAIAALAAQILRSFELPPSPLPLKTDAEEMIKLALVGRDKALSAPLHKPVIAPDPAPEPEPEATPSAPPRPPRPPRTPVLSPPEPVGLAEPVELPPPPVRVRKAPVPAGASPARTVTGVLPPPGRAAVTSVKVLPVAKPKPVVAKPPKPWGGKVWCDQCQRQVTSPEAGKCVSAFCKAKVSSAPS